MDSIIELFNTIMADIYYSSALLLLTWPLIILLIAKLLYLNEKSTSTALEISALSGYRVAVIIHILIILTLSVVLYLFFPENIVALVISVMIFLVDLVFLFVLSNKIEAASQRF